MGLEEDVVTIQSLKIGEVDAVAPLVAAFRVTLMSYKGIHAEPDIEDGKEELVGYLNKKYPVFIALEDEKCVGYIVCRIDGSCVWAESLFVCEEYRRKHIASALFAKAEEVAKAYGQDTVYNYVHPNNNGVIAFLKSRGYNVLNLIEIRKPYTGEKPTMKIQIAGNEFDY